MSTRRRGEDFGSTLGFVGELLLLRRGYEERKGAGLVLGCWKTEDSILELRQCAAYLWDDTRVMGSCSPASWCSEKQSLAHTRLPDKFYLKKVLMHIHPVDWLSMTCLAIAVVCDSLFCRSALLNATEITIYTANNSTYKEVHLLARMLLLWFIFLIYQTQKF